jgi:transketolase
VRVVSMPCTRRFDRQPEHYRQGVLPPHLKCVAVEAGATAGWWKYVGRDGAVVGLDRFGASAPAGKLFEFFDISIAAVVRAVEAVLSRGRI